jgi:hypothetical protein
MTTFDDREKGFEKKFAHDADLQFKAESRRNKMLAEWAGRLFKMTDAQIADYVKDVRKADLAEKGDEDLFRKLRADFDQHKVAMSDADLRGHMHKLMQQAIADVQKT